MKLSSSVHVITYSDHETLGWGWRCSCGHFNIPIGTRRGTREEAERSAAEHLAFWTTGN
jgi:hypothetical protein